MQLVHSTKPVVPRESLARLPTWRRQPVSKSTIYMLMARREFPPSINIGRMVAWSEVAVLQWVQDRVAAATTDAQQGVQQ